MNRLIQRIRRIQRIPILPILPILRILRILRIVGIAVIAGILILDASPAISKCASGWAWVYPGSGQVPMNAVFILEGYGGFRRAVESMEERSAYLQSGDDRVFLIPRRVYHGQMGRGLVVLDPERPLKAGETYKIYAPSIEPGALGYPVAYEWNVLPMEDKQAPALLSDPRVVDRRHIPYGCGPEVEIDVRVETTDGHALFAEVELRKIEKPEKKPPTYLLPVRSGLFTIGHDMCSGAFKLSPGVEYEARITLVDAAGNRSPDAVGRCTFFGPSP